jgi:hypothetical protein
MKRETHKDLVPFVNEKPLVPGKGGGSLTGDSNGTSSNSKMKFWISPR